MSHISGRIFMFLLIALLGTTMQVSSHGKETQEAETTGGSSVYLPMINKYSPWSAPYAIETNNSLATGTDLNQKMQALKPTWIRLNDRISWKDLQPQQNGPIQWDLLEDFENELRALRAVNAKPILIVDEFPTWATLVANSCSPLKPEMYDDYANFVVALVQRYKGAEFNVKNWELGNEVDVDPVLIPANSQYGCWGDISDLEYYGGQAYGNMVKVVGNAIKQADPTARVWLGGLMLASPNTTDPNLGKPERFLRGILSVGAAPYFDVVPYHAHTLYYGVKKDSESQLAGDWLAWGGGMVGKANYLRQLMNEYGVSKTLSVNEIGVGCRDDFSFCVPEPGADFLDFQASMIVRLAVRAVSVSLDSFVWYTLNGPGWRNMGLLDGQIQRPAYISYQNLIQRTAGTTFSYPITYSADIEAYAFSNSAEIVQVVWAKLDGNYAFSVPADKFLAAFDRDGNAIAPVLVGNTYQFTAKFEPIYIELSH
ncbi:MAG: hypothetical protein H6636_12990 [Anaerolineales bacterium]|nr:hypothetical protein [Anaerolineales bacterium]